VSAATANPAEGGPLPGVALSRSQTNWLLLGLGLATGMEFYVFDAMNLVLVDLAGTLGVSFDEASWLLTVYSCTLFLGVPVCIWLAGHFGYKRYLIATTLLFATMLEVSRLLTLYEPAEDVFSVANVGQRDAIGCLWQSVAIGFFGRSPATRQAPCAVLSTHRGSVGWMMQGSFRRHSASARRRAPRESPATPWSKAAARAQAIHARPRQHASTLRV